MKRQTKQKTVVLQALAQRPHSTAGEIHAIASELYPGIGLATVYRILSDSVKEGVVRYVTVAGDGVDVYDTTLAPHSHMQCRICGDICDLPEPDYTAVLSAALAKGLEIEHRECCFLGVCPTCKAPH